MNKLAYLASLSVVATGIAFAQNSGASSPRDSNSSGNTSATTSQSQKTKTSPKAAAPGSDPSAANPATAPATSPSTQAPVPDATIRDQPGRTADPEATPQPRSGTMGTTGKTPATNTPQSTSPDQAPNSSTTPDSPPPHTSLVGASAVGSSIAPTEALVSVSRKPPHGPDAGTQPDTGTVDNVKAVNSRRPVPKRGD
jgi:hypothetical protein